MSLAVRVQNLGKMYRLRHEARGASNYVALRDVLAQKFRSIFSLRKKSQTSYETFWALRDISFDIMQGEAVAIIGRNGAGKSTLLKLLSRITTPSAGRIEVEGRVASLLEVGTGFHPELTGRENIFLNGAILGMSRLEIKKNFDQIVAFAENEKFLDTPVKRYSSGMYMRLAFAVAAHLEPEILVVDEVLAVGDTKFQKKCLGKMNEVSKSGRTILFVSHNMSAVQNLCTRAILLEDGQLKFDGSTEAAIERYAESASEPMARRWTRPTNMRIDRVGYESIQARIEGEQPNLRLVCEMEVRGEENSPQVFLAVDICDQSFTPIMQALPHAEPFLRAAGLQRVTLEVELPPLIPGVYSADFWLGSHYSQTLDYIRSRISFEILDPPAEERTFPYSAAHGFMVPISRCRIETNEVTEAR